MAGELWQELPAVPQSILVGENRWLSESWKFVGRFTDAELRSIASAWTVKLLEEAHLQRKLFVK